jgi:hypothetical protein
VETKKEKLNRYTSLPILLDLLKRKKLVLLDPKTWEDKNDSQIILEYKRRKKIRNFFAICFSTDDETIHGWKNYASGISGCLIEFDKEKLLNSFIGIKGIRKGNVHYKKVTDVEENSIEVDDIPFIKRYPYRIETEFRILWEGRTDEEKIEFDISLNSINKITISQNMPKDVYNTIVSLLREDFKDPEKRINRSTLFENQRWIKAFKSI